MDSSSSNYKSHNNSFKNLQENFQLQKEKPSEIKRPMSGQNQSKMDIKSNSIFAFQEFDKYSSFFSNTNPSSIVQSDANHSRKISNSNSVSSSSSSDQSDEEEIPIPINPKKNKRLSDTSSLNDFLYKFKELKLNMCCPNNNNIQPQIQQFYPPSNINNINNNNIINLNNNNNKNNINNFRRKSFQYYPNFNFMNFPNPQQTNFQNMNNPFMVNTNINSFNAFNNARNISTIPIQNNQPINQKKRNSFSIPVPNYFYNEDQNMLDNLNSYLTDQTRCRQVQEKLEEKKNDPDFINKFYHNIESNLVDIIDHQFGNYVIQKFFNIILYQNNKDLINQFFSRIQSDLFKISVNNYGTRVFQKSLEKLDKGIYSQIETPELDNIIRNLVEKHIFALCYDKNGNHVFQKIARIFPKEKNQFIFDQLNQYAIEISKLKQGATILQNTFKYASPEQLKSLILKILSDMGSLVNDEYGNYTIQLIIELKEKVYNDIIYDYLIKNCASLSKKKFSSNVIDKCIIEEDENSHKLVNYIIKNNLIKDMITDQFGNYVIQKALKVSNRNTQIEIINQIKPEIDQLKQTNIGRKIYEHLMQSYSVLLNDNINNQ